jgi:hypothetical protein
MVIAKLDVKVLGRFGHGFVLGQQKGRKGH